MRSLDLIIKKREGREHNEDEVRFLIQGYVNGEIPEYQMSAWLMAVFFQGMTSRETGILTRVMIDSGSKIDLATLSGPFIDKHSTGGVGDKVSLILAPIVAAAGIKVPMMSGRGLGHTGGTLDKLESISGYTTNLTNSRFVEIIKSSGFAMTGQTKDVVPADKLLYSLRDVTGTVESIPLITASIMSKKFAEGAESLVFDVKCGEGAFMKTVTEARALAESLVRTGKSLGREIVAVLTAMDEPLGYKIGNFLEVEESIECLSGNGPDDLMEVTLQLAGWMLKLGGKASSVDQGIELSKEFLKSGQALELFYQNVELQGGDPLKLKKDLHSRRSSFSRELKSPGPGFIQKLGAYDFGMAAVILGAGRNKADDEVLGNVGIELLKKVGDQVTAGEPICIVYGEEESLIEEALVKLAGAVSIGPSGAPKKTLILEEIA